MQIPIALIRQSGTCLFLFYLDKQIINFPENLITKYTGHQVCVQFPCSYNINDTFTFQNPSAFFFNFISLIPDMKKGIIDDYRIKSIVLIRHLSRIHDLKGHVLLLIQIVQSALVKVNAGNMICNPCRRNRKIRRTTCNFKDIFVFDV